ncbi:TetR/AcrR family transcriptional regulator C-terminal domain-containing protein [Actinoallomurus rhizosphaericola]|uniref:TetR/AcrR family transcriptional regulator C-terminal domain-containing protein n=1 Tax=Actinoallomurus rhizosphaericola TaxID=2952536 RepID=UPI002093150C|nr:TetR/AcrR family transcriptional regulator C-terminal domain-containing protein [Actinoallomurus rhizosphaericola]MCO5995803.1 TetR/AcrR family transcriptional regulator C-terminal domain-containing protein [Actinoallomurus rhizosphaericola]
MAEHTAARPRGRPPRADREQVVHTALRLLGEVGLDALTMRRLADALGVQAGTLYGYFPTKRALLTAMAEAMMSGCQDAGENAATPREQVLALARGLRTALLAHRDGARVYAGTHAVGPNTLGFSDTLIGALRQAGVDAAAAVQTALLIVHFTTGHVLEEQAATGADPELLTEIDDLHQAIAQGEYPQLAETHKELTGTDFTQLYERGLQLLTSDVP